jgi:hypothetical protein
MEIGLPQVVRYLYNVYLENKNSDNCAQLLEEEFNKINGIKSLDDEHDCHVSSMNSLNIHYASDMPSHKLGDAMFDEYDIFSPASFDEQNILYLNS